MKAAPVPVLFSMLQLVPAAARLAVGLDHPVYDRFYLASAIQTQYPVVTAGARFHDKVRGHPYLSNQIPHVARTGLGSSATRGCIVVTSLRLVDFKNFADVLGQPTPLPQAWSHLRLEPLIQHVMQEDIRNQQRYRTARSHAAYTS